MSPGIVDICLTYLVSREIEGVPVICPSLRGYPTPSTGHLPNPERVAYVCRPSWPTSVSQHLRLILQDLSSPLKQGWPLLDGPRRSVQAMYATHSLLSSPLPPPKPRTISETIELSSVDHSGDDILGAGSRKTTSAEDAVEQNDVEWQWICSAMKVVHLIEVV